MTTFLFSYRMPAGNQPGRPGAAAAWGAFFEGIGPSLLDPGNPVFDSATLGNCETGGARLSGFSLVTADDLEAAVAMASQCPALDQGGGVEIGVITEIYRDKRLTAQD